MDEDRLAALEARLRLLEDEREIARLIAGYGPLVDAGATSEVASMWTEDGVYDVDELYLDGRQQIAAMVDSGAHRSLIERGCAHFLGPARVTVDGDEAVAICHSLLVLRRGEGYAVVRAGANHWQLRRTDEGWQTVRRTSRLLDGREEASALLATGARGELP